MSRIKVIDSPCGFGKTSYAIQTINQLLPSTNVLYITPFLKETNRIKNSCPDKNFVLPDVRKGKGSKLTHLIDLISHRKNVCSTHALLQNINDELIEALRVNNYILFLDEAFQVLENYNLYPEKLKLSEEQRERMTKKDIDWLLSDKMIQVNDDYSVSWIDPSRVPVKYEELKKAMDRGIVYMVHNSLLLWSFPYEVFGEGIFDEIYVMTYLWEAQYQYYYYKYFGIEYEKYNVFKNENSNYSIQLTENNDYEKEWKKSVKEKIKILEDDKLNKIGASYTIKNRLYDSSLSLGWYEDNCKTESMTILKNNIDNYFRHLSNSKSNQRLWCCFKDYLPKLRSKGATSTTWLEISSRATNDWRDRTVLCYAVNRYPNVNYQDFFRQKGINIDQEKYAVSDLVQWVWRSAIRDGKEIQIYIPSKRMRNLLIKFLEN